MKAVAIYRGNVIVILLYQH